MNLSGWMAMIYTSLCLVVTHMYTVVQTHLAEYSDSKNTSYL